MTKKIWLNGNKIEGIPQNVDEQFQFIGESKSKMVKCVSGHCTENYANVRVFVIQQH